MSLIVALDPPENVSGVKWCIKLVDELGSFPQGFKIGLPLIIKEGVNGLKEITSIMDTKLIIADLKLADIGFIMSLITKLITNTKVNTIIAHAFVGIEGALDELSSTCKDLGINLVLVVFMSHPGAREIMQRVFNYLIDVTKKVSAWGAVLPATMPEIIKIGREKLGNTIKILAPGIGAQGAKPGDALCAGANYEIVGRLITRAKDPRLKIIEILKEQNERLRRCHGL